MTDDSKTLEANFASAPKTRGERFKRHCARRWWLWLAGFLVFVVVIVIIVIFAIIPPVAQKTLDKTVLHVESLSILDPTPDQFSLSVEAHITGGGGIAKHARLDPMTVQFSLPDRAPFMSLPLDGVHGGDDIPVIKRDHITRIANPATFAEFALVLMHAEEFKLNVNGRTTLRLGAIKTGVNYREELTLKGLNNLSGMVITSYGLVQNETDHNMVGKVLIPNPTVFTLEVGDVALKIAVPESSSTPATTLGRGTLTNLTITPGMKNTYDFKAFLDPEALEAFLLPLLQNALVLEISAESSVVNDVEIPWLSAPLSSFSALVPVNTSQELY